MSAGTELWVRCRCGHVWIAAHLPMEIRKAATLARHLHCPGCAGPASHIFVASEADVAAARAQPQETAIGRSPARP